MPRLSVSRARFASPSLLLTPFVFDLTRAVRAGLQLGENPARKHLMSAACLVLQGDQFVTTAFLDKVKVMKKSVNGWLVVCHPDKKYGKYCAVVLRAQAAALETFIIDKDLHDHLVQDCNVPENEITFEGQGEE